MAGSCRVGGAAMYRRDCVIARLEGRTRHDPVLGMTVRKYTLSSNPFQFNRVQARLSGNRRPTQREDVAKSLTLLDLDLFSPLESCIHNPKGETSMIFQGLTPLLGSCIDNLWQAFRKS